MTKKMHAWQLAALPLAIGLASFSGTANAVDFRIGDVRGQFDSQLSVGMSVSTTNADKRFIDYRTPDAGGQAVARTSDDGRLNYKSGDIFSKVFRGTHDLELSYNNSGAFFRGKYWYDFEQKDGSQRFYDIDDSSRDPLQKASGVYLLDAFVYHNYFIGNNPGNIRLGRQVVSWGESTFIQNSINSINPIDVAAFRRPGAEVKEGLLPVEMIYLNQGLTSNLSMEAFYQLKWAPSVLDNCGTFFGSDTLAKGCVDRLVVSGEDYPQGDPNASLAALGLAPYIVRSRKDQDARDDGQWGVAFRYFAQELNDTEFGFYAMNYHSRTPIYSNEAGLALGINALVERGVLPAETFGALNPIDDYYGNVAGPSGYFFEYPEDIRLYGVSFQTNLGATSVGGELSYRPNMPLQINTGDMSRTSLLAAGIPLDVIGMPGVILPVPGSDNTHRDLGGNIAAGDYIRGYDRKGFWQAQVTAIHFIERVLGASRLSLVGEVGYNRINGISNSNGSTKYGRDSLFGQSPFSDEVAADVGLRCSSLDDAAVSRSGSWCENDGFYTTNSWGYRGVATLDYNNVFRGINLSPSLAWSHDVSGYSPNFNENAKSVSLGLRADYANKYTANLSYTTFFDGKYNTNVDRDFASVSVSVSF